MTDEVVERLDRIIFLLSLAHAPEIDRARALVLSDPISAAILTEAAELVPAGELKRRVASATRQSERTVNRRLSQLVAAGWVRAVGSGGAVKYEANELA